ncbi:hypothetical protein IAQ61_009868 [Plenodomus lingam]|uniref:uncharacterized protein n=1 Tax=Leptosphaeria maculans TaxID=5022 RepID=UPI0033231735|nr:hypothetical protein IAQ61_009868 [Plenodomus lingam]
MGKFDSHASLVTLPSSCQISLQMGIPCGILVSAHWYQSSANTAPSQLRRRPALDNEARSNLLSFRLSPDQISYIFLRDNTSGLQPPEDNAAAGSALSLRSFWRQVPR